MGTLNGERGRDRQCQQREQAIIMCVTDGPVHDSAWAACHGDEDDKDGRNAYAHQPRIIHSVGLDGVHVGEDGDESLEIESISAIIVRCKFEGHLWRACVRACMHVCVFVCVFVSFLQRSEAAARTKSHRLCG